MCLRKGPRRVVVPRLGPLGCRLCVRAPGICGGASRCCRFVRSACQSRRPYQTSRARSRHWRPWASGGLEAVASFEKACAVRPSPRRFADVYVNLTLGTSTSVLVGSFATALHGPMGLPSKLRFDLTKGAKRDLAPPPGYVCVQSLGSCWTNGNSTGLPTPLSKPAQPRAPTR